MKIKRFFGKDMRSALAEVKDVLGPDAVIMSNKRVNGGVEIMAAFDQDVEPRQSGRAAPVQGRAAQREPKLDEQQIADSLQALLQRQQDTEQDYVPSQRDVPSRDSQRDQAGRSAAERVQDEQYQDMQRKMQRPAARQDAESGYGAEPSRKPSFEPRQDPEKDVFTQRLSAQDATISAMKSDMSAIRELLETQVSGLMWQDMERREPTRAMLMKRLAKLGFTDEVADQISCFIPEGLSNDEAWDQTLDLLQGQIGTTRNDILSQGGVVALVGPTGVGKTTTIAKLAARYAQINGPDSVALVTTDTFRIAASEQLQTYARIIGCPIKVARDAEELNAVLVQFRQRRLVLIDTAGMSQRDIRLSEQLATLMENSRLRIRPYLVLSATAQASVQNEIVRQFKRIPLTGCIFTKLDECLSLGEVLSTSIHNSLPISYLTDGQQVPEDIQIADSRVLVRQAAAMDTQDESRYAASARTSR
ncbi:flagellar biosynthesis protein FlhF [Aliidiomarina maris]|uniref:Flagellar biosynthesis protein FlhF n=1 Tax=Aliidiomarina maris TaxID=531312 RepID=A0A327X3Q4_9GAMM|nr:flagellar biosynthesis protein FlhF [Aliidiomarina maris]MBA3988854.1 flagellar biosynthesis protein FlhF [Idiomarina sp.]MCL5050864.1 flagellar biosynthesis protein FlhF [Bacillota bacterium]RAK00760.1 flagellar biosynthesis protein FlhF [Aliidiomarina maris]RUO27242.1 flagellar biosynthesis protein FlhF [Aliidiomarina maris]